jgi:hypothetical protein
MPPEVEVYTCSAHIACRNKWRIWWEFCITVALTSLNKFLTHFRKLLSYDCTLCLFVWVPNFVGRSRKGRCNLLCHNYIFCVHRLEYLVYNLLMFSPYCLNVPRTSCCMAFHSAKKDLKTWLFWQVRILTCKAATKGMYDTEVRSIRFIRWISSIPSMKWG